MSIGKFIVGVSLLLVLSACSQKMEDPIDQSTYGYDYNPLSLGSYRIYQVDSLQYDLGSNNLPVVDSVRYYVKEEVVESYNNAAGETVYRSERYRAQQLGDAWVSLDVVTQSRSATQSYYAAGNLRYINLVFPIKEGITWDGNAFIPEDMKIFIRGESMQMFSNWEYRVLSSGVSEVVGDLSYDEVATIQQADSDNVIERRYSIEKYARGVGLIWRQREILDSYCKYTGDQGPCVGKSWHQKAGRGFRTIEVLVDYR